MRAVVRLMAVRNMLPAVVAQAVALLETTSLVSVIGVMEVFRSATVVNVHAESLRRPFPRKVSVTRLRLR